MFSTTLFWLMLVIGSSIGFRCDRRPYGSNTPASAPDGRFNLQVLGTTNSYVPDQLYTVQIFTTGEESQFSSFIISAEGELKPDARNPRRLIAQYPGQVRPQDPLLARFSDRCPNSVEQAANNLKTSVDVYWQAPGSGNGCVTLRSMVAENEQVWFEDGMPLTVKLCEDMRQPDDATQQLNYNCDICDTAKYEVQFVGMWSRNTHPNQFPENDWVQRYSDLVGASHSADFILWTPGTLASPGLRDLAEHANTTALENEIREKIGDGVRTLVKGKGHTYKKIKYPTYAFFRADKDHHVLTTAIAFHPSPDWFLGVTRFELCQSDNTWLQEKELNLYPWDAGTDSGISYESANIETFPQDAIARVQMSSYDRNSPFYETDMKDLFPFGKLRITLMRTYHKDCEETTETENEVNEGDAAKETSEIEPEEPSRYQNPEIASGNVGETPIEPDPDSSEDCPMSQWTEWSPCEGICNGGHVTGYKWRERYHLVDGIPIEKYDPNIKASKKEVSQYCKENFEDFERSECEEECSAEDGSIKASKRLNPIQPGHPWNKKRDMALLRA